MRLKVDNLSYEAGGRPLAHGLSLSLSAGEVLHLTGENGAGKSLLARVILGLHPALTGTIELSCRRARYLPQLQNRASHLPYSLGEVIKLGGARNLLLEESRLGLPWNRASGGERQRVLLSRFFCEDGDFLVLDEPFNHLDGNAREKVRALLRSTLAENSDASALLISHDDNPESWLGGIPVRTIHLEGGE